MSITLAVSIDYSLFILSRYREEIMQGLQVGAAVEQSLGTAGHTVLVSGTTLAVHALLCPALRLRAIGHSTKVRIDCNNWLRGVGCLRRAGIFPDDSTVFGWSRRGLRRGSDRIGESFSHALNASLVPRLLWQCEGELHLLYAYWTVYLK